MESVEYNEVEMQAFISTVRKLQIFSINIMIILKSPLGAILAFILAWVFDFGLNMFSIEYMFAKKIDNPFVSYVFSFLGSAVLGISMLVLGMYNPSPKEDEKQFGKTYADKLLKKIIKQRGYTSFSLMILSIFISFIGLMIYIIPNLAFEAILFTPILCIQISFCFLLSCISPVTMFIITNRLNKEASGVYDQMISSLNEKGRKIVNDGFENVVPFNNAG